MTLLFKISIAQIPNFSFENWTSAGTYSVPDSWSTLNHTTASYSIFTATKGTPGNPGNTYLKLTSTTNGTAVINGVAVSGKLDTLTLKAKSGFASTLQPVSFSGKWQHMIFGSSQGSVKATFTKWNTTSNKRDTIAVAAQTLSGMAMSWANFNIPFSYKSSLIPDSCIIELRASGSNPTDQDYLWVDNLSFTGSVTGSKLESLTQMELTVYPNPATEQVSILSPFAKINNNGVLTVYNMIGETLKYIEFSDQTLTLNISDWPKGIYFFEFRQDGHSLTKKVIVQ